MLRTLRARFGPTVAPLALILAMGTVVPTALHAPDDDPLCHDWRADHGQGASLARNGAVEPAQHCDVCHWLRSVRSFSVALHVLNVEWAVSSSRSIERTQPAPLLLPALLSARAPPA